MIPTSIEAGPENPIERTGTERQVVAANATLRQAVFTFDVRLLEMAGIAGRKLDSAEDVPGKGVVFVKFSINDIIPNQGGVADAKFGARFDYWSARAFIFPIDERHVELNPQIIIDVVTNEDLGNGTFNVLVDGVGDFIAIVLQSVEVSELFGETTKETAIIPSLRFGGGVNGT